MPPPTPPTNKQLLPSLSGGCSAAPNRQPPPPTNAGALENHEKVICSRPTFGTADRFGNKQSNNNAPGPHYDFPEMVLSTGLARNTPAFVMGGAGFERDSFMHGRIKNDMMVPPPPG